MKFEIKNKRVISAVLSTLLITSICATGRIENQANAFWPFTYNQSKRDNMKKEIEQLLEKNLEQIKLINEKETAALYFNKLELYKDQISEAKESYRKYLKIKQNLKELYIKVNTVLNLEQLEIRKQKEEQEALELRKEHEHRRKLEEEKMLEQRLQEEHRRKLEIQKIEQERLEKEKIEKINNAKAQLKDKIDGFLRNMEVKSESEKAGLIQIYEEIAKKINSIDNLDRVPTVLTLINNFNEEIIRVLNLDILEQEKILKTDFDVVKGQYLNIVQKLEEEITEINSDLVNVDGVKLKVENLKKNINESQLSMIKEQVEEIEPLENKIETTTSLEADIKLMTDEIIATRERLAIYSKCIIDMKHFIDSNIETIVKDIKIAKEEQLKIEQRIKEEKIKEDIIDNYRDFDQRLDMIRDKKLSVEDLVGGNKKAIAKINALYDAYERYLNGGKIVPSKGMILYGPPGTGKTTLARYMAAERNTYEKIITPSMLVSEDGVKRVIEIIEETKKMVKINHQDATLIIDEIDAIAQIRSTKNTNHVLVVLMNALDKLTPEDGIIIIATTNRREALDPAIVRSGRLDQNVEVTLPNTEDKEKILEIRLKHLNLDKKVDLSLLSSKMKMFTGADIVKVAELALASAMQRDNINNFAKANISQEDLESSIVTVIDEKATVLF